MTNTNERTVYIVRNNTIEKMPESDALYLAYGSGYYRMLDEGMTQTEIRNKYDLSDDQDFEIHDDLDQAQEELCDRIGEDLYFVARVNEDVRLVQDWEIVSDICGTENLQEAIEEMNDSGEEGLAVIRCAFVGMGFDDRWSVIESGPTAEKVGDYTIYAIQNDFRDSWCGSAWDWFVSIANDDYALTGNHKPAEGQSKAEYFEECKTKVYNDAAHCDTWIEFNDKDDAIEWLEGQLEFSDFGDDTADRIKDIIKGFRGDL